MQPNKQYITSTKNRVTGQFTGNTRQILSYLLTTYRKISPIQLNNFKKEVTNMHYEPVTPVDNIYNKVEYLLEHGNMEKFPYYQPKAI